MMSGYRRAGRAFSQFYNQDVTLITIKKTGITSVTATTEVIAEIKADVQDYNGGLAQKEYGLVVDCQKRMYCEDNEHLVEGVLCAIGDRRYQVQYVRRNGLGVSVLLKEVRDGNQL